MSRTACPAADRRRIHEEVDAILDTPGLSGIHFSLLYFISNDIESTFLILGDTYPDSVIYAGLLALADQCRIFDTPETRSVLPDIEAVITCLERTHAASSSSRIPLSGTKERPQ